MGLNNNIKSISPVIAVALLIVTAVTSVVYFQDWFNNFSSLTYTKVEKIDINAIDINYFDANILYIKNSNSQNINFSDIKINSISCGITGTISANQMNEISLNNCTENMDIGSKEVVLITEVGIFTKYLMLKSVYFNSTSEWSGSFSGYAWEEQLGYISFNGSGYQVLMNNNRLYGNAYSENLGYISFNGTNYNVTNVGGVLVGYAWGEQTGYISFNGTLYQTTFNDTALNGNAYSENFGFIHFTYPTFYQIIY